MRVEAEKYLIRTKSKYVCQGKYLTFTDIPIDSRILGVLKILKLLLL